MSEHQSGPPLRDCDHLGCAGGLCKSRPGTPEWKAQHCHRLLRYFGEIEHGAVSTCAACNGPVEWHRNEPCPDTQADFSHPTRCVKCGKHMTEHPLPPGREVPTCTHPNRVSMGEDREWCHLCGAAYYAGVWVLPLHP